MKPGLWINGDWIQGKGEVLTSTDPAKNEIIWQATQATPSQVDEAIKGAQQAFYAWSQVPFEQRVSTVERFISLLDAEKEAMALTIAQETGKCLWEARTEVSAMLGKASISKQAYLDRTGQRSMPLGNGQVVLRHRPHGVIAVFGPFNFPGHLPNGHIIPGLLAGNTIVFKPSELTPCVAEKMVAIWQKAMLPDGVIQLLQGNAPVGKALIAHPDIAGVFFTGSSKTGHLIATQLASTPHKILALEMGGNNPLVVGEVKDIDATVYHIIQSAFITTGQRCTCARRLLIPQGDAGDEILNRLVQVTNQLHIDIYDAQPQPFMGSLISAQAAEHLINTQTQLQPRAKHTWLTMQRLSYGSSFVTPGILEFDESSVVEDQEYFGPLLQVFRYQKFTQAIVQANQTRYGLSAGLISDSPDHWQQFIAQINAGIVNWNGPTTGALGSVPFGGIGASGNHRPSAYYAADYCAYPVSSIEHHALTQPEQLPPGFSF